MECKFYVGQKVVCVNDTPGLFLNSKVNTDGDMDGLKAGRVYTISAISSMCDPDYTTTVQVTLKEIKRKETPLAGFDHRRFKPLDEIRDELRKTTKRKTDISIFQKMCGHKYTDHEIAELLTNEEDA
jgi:hypothetical protein